MLASMIKFYFYRRYRWRAQDFEQLQNMVFGHSEGMAQGLLQSGVMQGFEYSGATGLNVGVTLGSAMGPSGDLLVKASNQVVPIPAAASGTIKSLVVARTVSTDGDTITKPTNPFNSVPLTRTLSAEIAVIQAAINADYPSKGSNDTILFGVEVNGAAVVSTDLSKCELAGKNSELSKLRHFDAVVGNSRHATYKTLYDAVTAGKKRIRVIDDQTISTKIDITLANTHIEIDQGVKINKSVATGFDIQASGVRISGGVFSGYSGGSDVPIRFRAAASGSILANTVFLNSNDYVDQTDGIAGYGLQSL